MVGLYSLRRVSYLSLACMGASMPFYLVMSSMSFARCLRKVVLSKGLVIMSAIILSVGVHTGLILLSRKSLRV